MFKKSLYACVAVTYITGSFLFSEIQRIAVIGGGGSGLTTTWLLDEDYDVTLFESQDRLGGHANTVEINVDGSFVPIEAGFEFISEMYYPHFFHLLQNILNLPLHHYTMTTSYYRTNGHDKLFLPPFHDGKIEWKSFGFNDIVTMVEFDHLLKKGKHLIKIQDVGISLEDFVEHLSLTRGFKDEFLYPFLAANWGVTSEVIKTFSAYNALKYTMEGKEMKNYQWLEIVGGTQKYIQALANQLINAQIKLSTNIINITHDNSGYTIYEEDGTISQFDYLVMGTNAIQARHLLRNVPETAEIRAILNHVDYFKTTIAIHGDDRFMPPHQHDWRVVNVRYDGVNSAMTAYKSWLSPDNPIFKSWVTLDVRNPKDTGSALPEPLYALVHYDHPVANLKYFQVQKALSMIQGVNNLWFVGNYTFDNDSHESAIISAINVARELAPKSERFVRITNVEEPKF